MCSELRFITQSQCVSAHLCHSSVALLPQGPCEVFFCLGYAEEREGEEGKCLGPWILVTAQHTVILDKSLNLSETQFSYLSNRQNSLFLCVSHSLCEGQMGKHFQRQKSCVCPGVPGGRLGPLWKNIWGPQPRVGLCATEGVWASPSSHVPSIKIQKA